jgi:hypothetical protein
MAGFEVTGWDRGGKVVFHTLRVDAPNDVVAVLYATGQVRRTAGSEAVIRAAKVEARAVARHRNATSVLRAAHRAKQ